MTVAGRYRLQNARSDEGEGDRIRTNHSLAMMLVMPVPCGQEGSGRKHPSTTLQGNRCKPMRRMGVMAVVCENDAERSGDENRYDVNATKHSMKSGTTTMHAA